MKIDDIFLFTTSFSGATRALFYVHVSYYNAGSKSQQITASSIEFKSKRKLKVRWLSVDWQVLHVDMSPLLHSKPSAVSSINRREIERQMSYRSVARRGPRRATRLDDLKHHRLAVVTDCHLYTSKSFHCCDAICTPTVSRPETKDR